MAMANVRGCATASDHPMATEQLKGMAEEEVDAVVGRWGIYGCIFPKVLGGQEPRQHHTLPSSG